jgi:hypothetical protein
MIKTIQVATVSAAMLIFTATALAASVSLVRKVPASSPGNFNYTYNYTCNNGKKGTLTVSSGNDNGARTLAELEAQDRCG